MRQTIIVNTLDRGALRDGKYAGRDYRSRSVQELITASVMRKAGAFDGACLDCGHGAPGEPGDPRCQHRARVNRVKNRLEEYYSCDRCGSRYVEQIRLRERRGGLGLCVDCGMGR